MFSINIDPIGNKISDFVKIKEIGHGQFGRVYKMKSKINNKEYAVKFIPVPKDTNQKKNVNDNKKIFREEIIMSLNSHPNIVHLYRFFQDNDYHYLVSEFIYGKTLESYVNDFHKNYPNSYIKQDFVIKIFKQILLGLKCLHDKKIFHRDIKPDNILLDQNNNVKITDFGLSAFFEQRFPYLSSENTFVGNAQYVCPEIAQRKPYDYKCDIFSLGYTMFFVMNFHLPTLNDFNRYQQTIKRFPITTFNNYYDQRLVQLIHRMYDYNPVNRPDTSECLRKLEEIEKNAKINDTGSFNIPINEKEISSMKCVLQCFYHFDNINMIKSTVTQKSSNIYFIYLFVNFFDIIEKKRNNSISDIKYNDEIRFLISKLWKKSPSIKCIKGVTPIVFYNQILSVFQEESSTLIKWNNNLSIYNYDNPKQFPQGVYPKIYNVINKFKMTYKNPFVDMLYFIEIISEKCPTCSKIIDAYAKVDSFLSLDNKIPNNTISNLIKNYMVKKYINKFIKCICGYSGNLIEEKMFYITPDYLVLDLNEGKKINFDLQIDLSAYIESEICPRNYELYAVINRETLDNSIIQYICSIKEQGQWLFHSEYNIEKCGTECLGVGIPSLAIYNKIASTFI